MKNMNVKNKKKIKKEAEGYGKLAPAFIEGARFALNNQQISVNERLPPEEKDGLSIKVLVVSTKGKIDFSRYDYNMKGWISPVLDIIFTHWFLIPEPPKE